MRIGSLEVLHCEEALWICKGNDSVIVTREEIAQIAATFPVQEQIQKHKEKE